MRVLLVYPPSQSLYGLPRFPMVGLTYLGTVLKKNGIDVEVLDMRIPRYNYRILKGKIRSFDPDIVGVGSSSFDFPNAKKVLKLVKKVNSSTRTVLGGPHASICPEDVSKEKEINYVFLGEGEEEFIKFLLSKPKNKKFINPQRLPVQNLDSLPFPQWDIFSLDDYRVRGKLTLPILTSRGCPYNCIYCSSWWTQGKKFRFRSPGNVVDEIENDIKYYGVANFSIVDDNFALDIERAIDICREIIKRQLKITWSCDQGMRADRSNKKLFRLMKKSGCNLVALGVEHADQEILDKMQKAESVKVIRESIANAKAAGLIVKAFFIVGGPGDNLEKTRKSISFFKETGVDIPRFSMMTAYPGTAMWDWVENYGKFIGNPYKRFLKRAPDYEEVQFETNDFPKEERIKAFQMAEKESEVWMIRQKLFKKIGPLTYLFLPIFRLDFVREFLKLLYRIRLVSPTD